MKVNISDLSLMAEVIEFAGHDNDENRDRYRAGNFPLAGMCKELDLDFQYRWDIWKESRRDYIEAHGRDSLWKLDKYSNAHLDTALRRIIRAL